ncbi:hypothetical protein ACFX2C_032848 [Malus domestica]
MEEPLLSSERNGELGEKGSEKWSSYQYVGRAGSVIPTEALAGTEVSVEEIRSAATYSDHYPPSLHAALVSQQEPDPSEQAVTYKGGYGGGYGGTTSELHRQIPDEVEIRELLIDHVGHRCCWGSRPARTWKIEKPYLGGSIDGKDKGPELGIWELGLKSQFPVIFIPHHESRAIIPHSEPLKNVQARLLESRSLNFGLNNCFTLYLYNSLRLFCCGGRGDIVCPKCNANQGPGFYKENQMAQCSACYGRGLIAHKDGSDSICGSCNGKGKIPCASCGSRGLIRCLTCQGSGSLLTRNVAVVKWKTL